MNTPQTEKTPVAELSYRCALCPPRRAGRSGVATTMGAALWAALFTLMTTAFGQNADTIADREVQRRQAGMSQGEAALARGHSALKARNYTVAYQEFKTAIGYLPDSVVSGKSHDEAADGA